MPVMRFLNTCIFDHGAVAKLAKTLKGYGVSKPFIVTDAGIKAAGLLDVILEALGDMKPAHVFTETVANPTEDQAIQTAELYTQSGADGVVALGGGNSDDCGDRIRSFRWLYQYAEQWSQRDVCVAFADT